MQLDVGSLPGVVPGLAVVTGGSVPGLRSLTGFRQAEYDSKLTRVSRTVLWLGWLWSYPTNTLSWTESEVTWLYFFESMPGQISPANGSPRPLSIQTWFIIGFALLSKHCLLYWIKQSFWPFGPSAQSVLHGARLHAESFVIQSLKIGFNTRSFRIEIQDEIQDGFRSQRIFSSA